MEVGRGLRTAVVAALVAAATVGVGAVGMAPAGASYGDVTVIELDDDVDLGRAPFSEVYPTFKQAMVLGPDGAFWIAAQQAQELVRITTAGEVTHHPVPSDVPGHVFDVTPGPDGNLWFTFSDPTSSQAPIDEPTNDFIGRITPTGTITAFTDDTDTLRATRGITVGSDGALWASSVWSGNLFRITTDGTMSRQGLWPNRPEDLATHPDGSLWWAAVEGIARPHIDVGRTVLGGASQRFDTQQHQGIVVGPDGDVWTSANDRITTDGEVTTGTSPCTAGEMAVAADGFVWQASDLGASAGGNVCRLSPDGSTTVLDGPPFTGAVTRAAAVGPDGAVWVLQQRTGNGPVELVRIDVDPLEVAPSEAPTGLAADRGDQQVALTWEGTLEDGGPGVGYRLYRDGELVAEVDGYTTSHLDTGLVNGTEYEYEVSVVNAHGEGPRSSVVVATPATVPDVPEDVTATSGVEQVAVAWDAPASDGGDDVSSYHVYQDGELDQVVAGEDTSWVDADGPVAVEAEYEVAAVNAEGEGPRSPVVAATPRTFSDVFPSHPFFTDVEWMAAEGLSTGSPPGPKYLPSAAVSRQAMSAFLYRLAGSPEFALPGSPSFADVPGDHPFFTEVEWMAAEGVSTGYGDGTYKPADPVSRQAMSAFLYRVAGSPAFAAPGVPSFSDVPTAHPFYDEVEWMAAEGISTGYADGTYKPVAPVTRQAMAAFLHRLADGPGVGV